MRRAWAAALSDAKTSAVMLASQPWLALFSMLVDASFLFVYGFVTQFARIPLIANANNLVQTVAQIVQQPGRFESPSLAQILLSPEAQPYLIGMALSLLTLFIISFVLYVLFQGTAWQVAGQLAGDARPWWRFIKAFAAVNVVWFLVLGLFKIVRDALDLRASLIQSVTKEAAVVIPSWVYYVLVGGVFVFALISYAGIRTHPSVGAVSRAFRAAQFRTLLPAFAVIIALFLLLQFMLVSIAGIPEALWLVIGIALVLPSLTWARIYINTVVARQEHGVRQ